MIKIMAEKLDDYLRNITTPNALIIIKPMKRLESSKETAYYVISRGYVNGKTSLC
jgi:hypothetical protein